MKEPHHYLTAASHARGWQLSAAVAHANATHKLALDLPRTATFWQGEAAHYSALAAKYTQLAIELRARVVR